MKKILIYGGSGQIGSRAAELLKKNYIVIAPPSSKVDVRSRDRVVKYLRLTKPDQILYAVGFTSIDEAINKPEDSFLLNAASLMYICHEAAKMKVPVLHLSTEVVFDGTKKTGPYVETDKPNPVSINGMTKRLGELVVLDADPNNCVARLIICYSSKYNRKSDIARMALKRIKAAEIFTATDNQEINPVYVDHLIEALEVLIKNQAKGIYHLGATNYTTPYKFVKKVVHTFGLDETLVKSTTFKEFAKTRPGARPQHEWLSIKKFERDFGKGILKTVEEGIESFKANYKV